MNSLLLPRTDAGVLAQIVLLGGALGFSLWWTRRPEFRLLILGIGTVLFALMGVRAAH